jgi:hypothetical protein
MKNTIIIVIVLLFFANAVKAQSCTSPINISSLPFASGSQTTCGAGNTTVAAQCSTSYGGGEEAVVYTYTATASGDHSVSLTASATWGGVFFHATSCTGSCAGSVTTGSGTSASGSVTLTSGTTYYIIVTTFAAPSCTPYTLNITGPPSPPLNDDCSGAVTLVSNISCANTAGTSIAATQSQAGCSGTANDDVWYKFVAVSTNETITITNTSGTTDIVTQVFSGSCGSLSSIKCQDSPNSPITLTGLTIGNTYFFRIYDYYSSSTSFNVCVTHSDPPPSCGTGNPSPTNGCSAAPLLTNINGFCGTTLASYTADGSFSGCASNFTIENNSWLRFTAADDEVVINYWITGGANCPSGIQLAVLTGTCGSTMTSIACSSNPTGGTGSSGTFTMSPLTPGQTYYLMIDGYAGDVCDYTFGIESGVALSCATCDVPACAVNSVVDDYYTLETEFINNSSWDAFGAVAATSTPLTSNGTAQGPITVCTDIPVTGLSFVGFDYFYNLVDVAPLGTSPDAVIAFVGAYQELTTGVCTALVSSSTNGYGGPQFDNTGGTPGTTAGAFDNTKPITVCYSYALDGSANNGDILSGVTVMGYGCAAPTNITYVSQTACSSNLYNATLTITWDPTDLPSPAELGGTGNVSLVVNGQTFTLTSAEQAAGSKNITLTGLTADGNPVNVTTSFATSTTCAYSETAVFTAPVACASACPIATTVANGSIAICSGSTVELGSWQLAVSDANPTGLVYSSVTPVAGTTLPNNTFPSGINTGCAPVAQTVMAYVYCDVDASSTVNTGDTYTLVSTYTLTVNPAASGFTVNPVMGSCGVAASAQLRCGGNTIATETGTAPTCAAPSQPLSGSFTAAEIATAIGGGATASCYTDLTYGPIAATCAATPTATVTATEDICVTGTGTSTLDLSTLVTAGNTSGTWSLVTANGATLAGSTLSAGTAVDGATVTVRYEIAATANCPANTYNAAIAVADCTVPTAAVAADIADPCFCVTVPTLNASNVVTTPGVLGDVMVITTNPVNTNVVWNVVAGANTTITSGATAVHVGGGEYHIDLTYIDNGMGWAVTATPAAPNAGLGVQNGAGGTTCTYTIGSFPNLTATACTALTITGATPAGGTYSPTSIAAPAPGSPATTVALTYTYNAFPAVGTHPACPLTLNATATIPACPVGCAASGTMQWNP